LRATAEITNLTFTEVPAATPTIATLRFAITGDPRPTPDQPVQPDAAGWAYLPDSQPSAGDVWIRDNQNINEPFAPGAFQWSLVIHEIGHALGLVHPFETDSVGGNVTMDPARDSTEYTIMAYRGSTTVPARDQVGFPEQGGEPQTWMQYDVAALQAMYGANYTTRAGNTVYAWDPATGQMSIDGVASGSAPVINRILMNVWDGGGNDTFDFSNYRTNVTADLRPGGWSSPSSTQIPITNTQFDAFGARAPGSISTSLLVNGDTRALIENATGGSGNDTLIGNQVGNVLTGNAGNDRLIGDGVVEWNDLAASVHRLYNATLRRAPDDEGFVLWRDSLAEGQSLNLVARGFVGSAEFQNAYGALDNGAFTTLLYNNVLGRAPDPSGFASWAGALNRGLPREFMVTGFSESAEFKAATNVTTFSGQIFRLYETAFSRAADPTGFAGWYDARYGGATVKTLVDSFIGSQEFTNTYGSAVDNAAFVTLLYRNALKRDPDAEGLQSWVNGLSNGLARSNVVLSFSESQENITRTTPGLNSFMDSLTTWRDTLSGGAGDNTLTGGRGADTFVFNAANQSTNTVFGFESFDTLQFTGFGFSSRDQVFASLSQEGSNTVFSASGTTIVFQDTPISTLQNMQTVDLILS
jgi:Ca2+-binding RTX toxin-like protein